MAEIKQGATVEVAFTSEIAFSAYPVWEFSFLQNGRKIATYTKSDLTLGGDDHSATLVMPAADSAEFSPSRFAVVVKAGTADNSMVLVSDSITATVSRSGFKLAVDILPMA
jgi:hypothetical protein